jgi:hypothetical protein
MCRGAVPPCSSLKEFILRPIDRLSQLPLLSPEHRNASGLRLMDLCNPRFLVTYSSPAVLLVTLTDKTVADGQKTSLGTHP